MYITWLGQACFKIQGKEINLITDPYEPKVGLKLPRLNGDIVTISHDHYDHNNIKAISGNPFVVNGPGEYEINNIFIHGITSWHDTKEGSERGDNTLYSINFEGLKISHLGDLGTTLTDEQLDQFGSVDILMIPVGGIFTIDAKAAASVISQIEPRIVIPMHYKIPGLKIKLQGLEAFCREMGVKDTTPLDKFRITKKDLPSDETRIIILKP